MVGGDRQPARVASSASEGVKNRLAGRLRSRFRKRCSLFPDVLQNRDRKGAARGAIFSLPLSLSLSLSEWSVSFRGVD
jgi:hypothetical protein